MNSQISQIKDAIDIVALVGERVKLSRSGKNYRGLCPFHSEKSPSFFVTPELGRYKCFGCGESGDVFTFLQKTDNMSFGESLRELAKRAGIVLEDLPLTPQDKQKDRLLEVLSLAREYYHYLLTSHEIGSDARKYLHERGTSQDTIKLFGIGYASNSWDSLQRYLIGKKGFTHGELLDAGLIIRSEKGSYYDRFRGRIMFPLTNHRGQVVGFSGRLLDKNVKEAKYINTPETLLYHKSELLFGYSQLSRFIRGSEEVVVCEGEFDCLSSFQAHVENVVAIKGSALTQPQIKLLSHSVKRILLSLDSDSAGIEATKRAIALVNESGVDVSLRVISLIGGKDPDDIARENPARWREMVKGSISVYEYLLNVSFAAHDAKTGDGKREITKEIVPIIAQIANAVEQAHYVQLVSKRLGVKEDVFLSEMRKIKIGVVTSETQASQKEKKNIEKPKNRAEVLQRYLLLLLFASNSGEFPKKHQQLISSDSLTGIYQKLLSQPSLVNGFFDPSSFVRELPEELKDMFATLYLEATQLENGQKSENDWQRAVEELTILSKKEKLKIIAKRIGELESEENISPQAEDELKTLRSQLLALS